MVNTWWEGFDSLGSKCRESYNLSLLGSSVCGHQGNIRRWDRRQITTGGESKSALSSAANIGRGISHELVETSSTSTKVTINQRDGSKLQLQYTDVRELIADHKDLASLGTFIVFDLETTGFNRTTERIVEIALKDLRGGENSTFHTLVNPGRAVLNSHIHNISTNMVNRPDVPRMEDLIPILLQFVKSRQRPGGFVVLVAHNARTFDVPFLAHEFKRCSIEIPKNWLFLDSLPLAREAMKSEGTKVGARISLQALREHYGIPLVGSAHSAMSDVHSLSLVLQKLTFELKLPIAGLVQKTFRASELTTTTKKKKGL